MTIIERAQKEFARLPGVGPKTALRLVYHLLKVPKEQAHRLAHALTDLADGIRPCARCGNYSEAETCAVCRDPKRDRSVLCVVEESFDVGSIERTSQFRGMYHVLGGRLSPLDGVGPEQLRVEQLLERVVSESVSEVILATNSGVEGEATAVFLEGALRPAGVRITRLAQGIPVGSDLEYVDGSTLARALAGRREMGVPWSAGASGEDHER